MRKLWLVIALALGLAVAGTTASSPIRYQAPSCRPVAAPAAVYHDKVVTPTYEQTIIVGIPVAPDYYYSVGENAEERQARKKEFAAEVIKQFKDEFAVNQPQVPAPAPQTQKPSRESFRLVGGNSQAAAELDASILSVVNTSCVKCHKPGASKPGVQLLTTDRKLFVDSDPQKERRRRDRVYESIDSGEMPKGSNPLGFATKALFDEWRKKTTR